ncbi:MAG: hypothetical protein JSW31_04755, partial [Burkholderiales bacterium]
TTSAGPLPAFMLRKVAGNALALLLPGSGAKLRFHLVRLAASLGELKGHLRARRENAGRPAPRAPNPLPTNPRHADDR